MLIFGIFLAAIVSVLAAWGMLVWLMTRSVYPAGRVNENFGMAEAGGWQDDADDALRAASDYMQAEEERTQTKRLNAFLETEANFHRAA